MIYISIILGFLPGFAWLFFYMQEDPHTEPRGLIFKTFVYGMIGALAALAAEVFFNKYLPVKASVAWTAAASLFGLAMIEEIFKFLPAWFAVRKHPAFMEPIDAMIYTLIASLGFATLENVGALVSPFLGERAIVPATMIFQAISFRFVGATLLHALTGAVIGYFWATAIREFGRWTLLLMGIIQATVLHAFFNYLILTFEGYLLPILFLMIVGFFVLADFEKFKYKKI